MTQELGNEEKELFGGCHCGRVRFRCQVPVSQPILECNCSMYVDDRGLGMGGRLTKSTCVYTHIYTNPLSIHKYPSCAKKGFLHLIVSASNFQLESPPEGEATLSTYRFNTQTARHLFCTICGVQSYYRPRSHPSGFSVNARCLDGGVPANRRIQPFEGSNWEANIASIR